MNTHEQSIQTLIKRLKPKLHSGIYVFASLSSDVNLTLLHPIATFREPEGLTVVLEESQAESQGVSILFRAAWITLEVQSDLAAVGLTAVVSSALAAENIACNIIAAAFHDHLFVPLEQGPRALELLRKLSANAQG